MSKTFGRVSDPTAEFAVDPDKVVEFTIVGYDAVPHPTTGERQEHQRTFHALPAIKGEKVIAAYGRGGRDETGAPTMDAHSISRLILDMLLVEERDAFLDFLEDPNLAYSGEMFSDVMDYLVESVPKLPKGLSPGSSAGAISRGGSTSTDDASRLAAVGPGTSG